MRKFSLFKLQQLKSSHVASSSHPFLSLAEKGGGKCNWWSTLSFKIYINKYGINLRNFLKPEHIQILSCPIPSY